MTTEQYGATPDDWAYLDLVLGLTGDLLPVVSNPGATISPNSTMKDLGKTPSIYNAARQVVGMADWTQRTSTEKDIAKWCKEPDYGICIQTRRARAIDVDVPDLQKANEIRITIESYLMRQLPCRMRSNSGKFLLAFTLPGEYAKRTMKVDGGIIEFLATGQQFIAVGMHQSGVRYQWEGGLPEEFPELPESEFEGLWQELAGRFAIEPPSEGRARKRGETSQVDDPVVAYLSDKGLVLEEGRDGQLHIACPFAHEHTSDSGITATSYFPAGTNGYEVGHFACLHAHCANRGDEEFLDAIGYRMSEFEVVEAPTGEPDRQPLPKFERDKYGRIEATVDNVAKAVARPDICTAQIRFDEFRDEIVWSPDGMDWWRPFTDQDYVRLRIWLERKGFKPIGRELIRDVVHLVASENPFDSAINWLKSIEWDGQPRVEDFLNRYMGVEDSDYTRAVSLYMWTAMAGRVLKPGIKADMVPILVGEQGKGKSTAVAAMVPSADLFTEISFQEKDEDLARKMRGRILAEIGELRGLHSKELEAIKAFITRTHETWVPKYKEFAVTFPRRLLFIGTTNKDEFLADETGNRRWLPVKVNAIDTDAIRRDMLQLWAEGREIFNAFGILFREAEEKAGGAHAAHTISDAWNVIVEDWLNQKSFEEDTAPGEQEYLLAHEVLREALGFDSKQIGKREEMRIGNVLRAIGYSAGKKWVNGKTRCVWTRKIA